MKLLIWGLSFLFLFHMANAVIKLPPIFSDHMVLQQNMPVRIWGTASPLEKISVSIQNDFPRCSLINETNLTASSFRTDDFAIK